MEKWRPMVLNHWTRNNALLRKSSDKYSTAISARRVKTRIIVRYTAQYKNFKLRESPLFSEINLLATDFFSNFSTPCI